MVAILKIWNKQLGAVSWDREKVIATMEFAEDFIREGIDLSPIVMPLNELARGVRMYSFPNLPRETFYGLPGILADSLPDKFGNRLINAWLARMGKSEADFSPVDRLCYMGKRSMGALEFEPVLKGTGNQSVIIEIEELAALARQVLQKKEKLDTEFGKDDQKALTEIIRVGTSAGGARAKAVIALNEKTQKIRSGQVDVPQGFEHWLIKFDGIDDEQLGSSAGYGRIEYAYYKMATGAGINMSESRLYQENSRAHFMTRRFDRIQGNEKIHLQTLCGIAHYDYNDANSYSYEQLFQVMRKMKLPFGDAEQMYRRMVFNVLARNLDDHTKNISFILRKNHTWRLAPAYDVIYSYNPKGKWTSRHQMSINGKREDITMEDILKIGQENNIKSAKEIIGQILPVIGDWSKYAEEAGIDNKKIEEIKKNLKFK